MRRSTTTALEKRIRLPQLIDGAKPQPAFSMERLAEPATEHTSASRQEARQP